MDNEKTYYYLNKENKPQGPKTLQELKTMLKSGELDAKVMVAAVGDPKWVFLGYLLQSNVSLEAVHADGGVGPCPKCGHELESVRGELPEVCPKCAFRVGTPHTTNNLIANFWFTLTKKYCCFRGRATRVEFWSFFFIYSIATYIINLIMSIVRSCVNPVCLSEDEIRSKVAQAIGDDAANIDFSALKDIFLETSGLLQGGMSNIQYAICLATLIIPQLLSWAVLLPYFGVVVRRVHDVGWSGKWVVALYILIYGYCAMIYGILACVFYHWDSVLQFSKAENETSLAVFVVGGALVVLALISLGLFIFVLTLMDSKPGPNKYGPSPKYPVV